MQDIFAFRPGDTQDSYLYRLGSMKETGQIQMTWPKLTEILNAVLRRRLPPCDESSWRKRYKRLKLAPPEIIDEGYDEDTEQDGEEETVEENILDRSFDRVIQRDVRTSENRALRVSARALSLQEIMKEEIERFNADPPTPRERPAEEEHPQVLYAMLSDIHYGIAFENRSGSYSPEIAWTRVLRYADKLCQIGFANNISTIYVSLMGDMISGIIHQTIRLENREDLVHQIVGASELIAAFLYRLSENFEHVLVNSVPGNHSRIDPSFNDAARGEKMDTLITWYCKTKLEQIENVSFIDNEFDPTIGLFEIYGKTYICVHGDLDSDLHVSAMRIQRLMNEPLDYLLSGHLHVAETRFEHTGFIRNGSVCGSGDEYTSKKRLYSPPVQVCMLCSDNGVDAVYPVNLEEPCCEPA